MFSGLVKMERRTIWRKNIEDKLGGDIKQVRLGLRWRPGHKSHAVSDVSWESVYEYEDKQFLRKKLIIQLPKQKERISNGARHKASNTCVTFVGTPKHFIFKRMSPKEQTS